MLRGEIVGLRARHEADVPVLTEQMYDDVATWSRASWQAWLPLPPDPKMSPFRLRESSETTAHFSIVTLADDALAGMAVLSDLNPHNRTAHLGLELLPASRGKGLATDVLRVLCHYGFEVLGLHRLQMETLSENVPMVRAAERVGFRSEGAIRDAVWSMGAFHDEVVLSLLAQEWSA
jgi:RimJ/RimL family protein N-acetyltransferase